jgi:hypothetical protein
MVIEEETRARPPVHDPAACRHDVPEPAAALVCHTT